jgi:hypothetical protein
MQFLLDWGIGLVVFGTDYRFKTFHMGFIFADLSEAQIKWKFNPHEHFHLYCIIIMQCQYVYLPINVLNFQKYTSTWIIMYDASQKFNHSSKIRLLL